MRKKSGSPKIEFRFSIIAVILFCQIMLTTSCKSNNPALSNPPTFPDTPLGQSQKYTQWFYASNLEQLRANFSDEMKAALSLSALQDFYRQTMAQLGHETEVLDENVWQELGLHVYSRRARFEKFAGVIVVQFSLNDDFIIHGFFIRPELTEAPSNFPDYQTKTALRLPFDDEWYVFWGGRTIAQNYHAAVSDQRFAYDIVIVRNGSSHIGQGGQNSDYHCFGQPLLAPGPGKIVTVVNNISDNVPGQMNAAQPAGNYIIIDHENGEFSLMAHFQEGTITVVPGDSVTAGQAVGQCGNSGNSSEPHLHYHMQNTSVFGQGEGLPAQFQNYVADGVNISRGEPVKGQTIRNQ